MENKQQIKAALRKSYGDIIYSLSEMDNETFFQKRPNEGWSPGEILGHLILSSKAVAKGMSTPKLILRTTFGTNKGGEFNPEELIKKYKLALGDGLTAPGSFVYNNVKEKGRDALVERWSKELNRLLALIDKWSEKDLDKFQVPHPAIGKLSMREILFFTDFHTQHHGKQIQEVLDVAV